MGVIGTLTEELRDFRTGRCKDDGTETFNRNIGITGFGGGEGGDES